jgi:hypothetical protein
MSTKACPEPAESNNYPIVRADECLLWVCPECKKVNHSRRESLQHYKYIAECAQCECAVNVMEAP